jgi:hypothetical protein
MRQHLPPQPVSPSTDDPQFGPPPCNPRWTKVGHNPTAWDAGTLPPQPPARAPRPLAAVPPHLADRPATSSQVRVRTHAIREVVVLEVPSRLSDVAEDLDRTIQLALADGPRGVVCDLSAVVDGGDPAAFEVLATAGRHVRDWPGVPVVVACPDPKVRSALAAHRLGKHLTLAASMLPALSVVLGTPASVVESLRLAPAPTAPRVSRDFVTRTLLDWRLGRVIPSASLMVGELVASSLISAGTDLEVSVAWNLGTLRLSVRDHGDDLARLRHSYLDLNWRRLPVVAGLSRAFGLLPTADGGRAVWAVLNAPAPAVSSGRGRFGPGGAKSKRAGSAPARDVARRALLPRSAPRPIAATVPQPRVETSGSPARKPDSHQPAATAFLVS